MNGFENELLREALARYGLEKAACEWIRHNENITFRVDGQYLLRIHLHKPGFSSGALYDGVCREDARREEIKLLSCLANAGMRVQRPVENLRGETVTRLCGGVQATLLTWLEGRHMEKSDVTPETAYQIGAMIGQMHACLDAFPCGAAPRYDGALCERVSRALLAEEGALKGRCLASLLAALTRIGRALTQRAGRFRAVHSDLSLSNLLVTPEGISPIDFSLFGAGLPMMDLGAVYCYIADDACREQAARGYMDSGRSVNFMEIDLMFALNILLSISIHLKLWLREEWFSKRLRQWCEDVFDPLCRGEIITAAGFLSHFENA